MTTKTIRIAPFTIWGPGLTLFLLAVLGILTSCSGGPRDATTFREAIGAPPARTAAALVRAPVELPAHARVPKLRIMGRCTLIPGQRWSNGEIVREGTGIDPRGISTDPHVWREGDEWRMLLNHPVKRGTRFVTSISVCRSLDGSAWTIPKRVLRPIEDGRPSPIQFETPSRARHPIHGELLAVTEYRYVNGHRNGDVVSLWRADTWLGPYERLGVPLRPELPDEQAFTKRNGKREGGIQEPSVPIIAGPWIIVPYGKVTYGNGHTPSVGLAGAHGDAEEWVRLPAPILSVEDGLNGAGQPEVVRDPAGGWHIWWQQRMSFDRYVVNTAWSPGDLTTWFRNPNNPVIESTPGSGFASRITAPSPVLEVHGSTRTWSCWFFGGDDPTGQGGRDTWIGWARGSQEGR